MMTTMNKVTEIFNITQECGDFLIVKFKNALLTKQINSLLLCHHFIFW